MARHLSGLTPINLEPTNQLNNVRQQKTVFSYDSKSNPPSTERDERQPQENRHEENYILLEISKRIKCNNLMVEPNFIDQMESLKILNHEISCRMPCLLLSPRVDFTPYLKQCCIIFTIDQEYLYFLAGSDCLPYKVEKITKQSRQLLTIVNLEDHFEALIVVYPQITNQYHTDLTVFSLQISSKQSIIVDYHGQLVQSLKRIVIFKKNRDCYEFVTGDFCKDYHLAVMAQLEQGQYVIYWSKNSSQNLVVNSLLPVDISEICPDVSKQLFFSILVENNSDKLILYERTLMLKIGVVVELFRNRTDRQVQFRCQNMESQEKYLLFEDDYHYQLGMMVDKNELIRIFLINDVPAHLVTPRVTIMVDGVELTTDKIEHFQN